MTSPESRYEMDHVRSMFDGYPFSESLRSRYLKSWERWLAWCQGHNLQPGAARRADVDRVHRPAASPQPSMYPDGHLGNLLQARGSQPRPSTPPHNFRWQTKA